MYNNKTTNEALQSCLSDICKWAPQMPVSEAMRRAHDITSLKDSRHTLEMMLVVLATEYFGINENGDIPEEVKTKMKSNPRLKWILDQMMEIHCGISCSPYSGGIQSLMELVDEHIRRMIK